MDEKIEEKVGYWIYSEKGCVINCSNCGERLELCYPDGTEIRATKYCPNCGAKMDKQRDLTGGMLCRPIRIEVQNLVYLMGEWAIENNMCWNDEHAKKLAYYILDNHYCKESDTAREIYKELFEKQTEVYNNYVFKNEDYDDLETNAIINFSDSLYYAFEKHFKEKYGVDLGE